MTILYAQYEEPLLQWSYWLETVLLFNVTICMKYTYCIKGGSRQYEYIKYASYGLFLKIYINVKANTTVNSHVASVVYKIANYAAIVNICFKGRIVHCT